MNNSAIPLSKRSLYDLPSGKIWIRKHSKAPMWFVHFGYDGMVVTKYALTFRDAVFFKFGAAFRVLRRPYEES